MFMQGTQQLEKIKIISSFKPRNESDFYKNKFYNKRAPGSGATTLPVPIIAGNLEANTIKF